ncbi:MAG: hypothetical protein PHS14_00220 [Elusimicrobia bacterium]|nr:hypothetical protein [Elusimicrobiota bacterium]
MGVTDFTGGAAQAATGNVSNIKGLISGQTSPLTSYLSNLTGLNFLFPKGAGPFSQPNNPKSQLSGFAFDFYGEDDLELDIDATDHWAEDNSSIQDHAAISPIRGSLSGFVGEYVIPNPNSGIGGALRQLEQKLATVSAYAGKYTPGTVQAIAGKVTGAISTGQNYVQEISQYAQQAQNILNMFKPAGATRQQNALATLMSAALSRQTFTLMMPWVQVQNVMITNIRAHQSGDTTSKSEFTVSVKQIRTIPVASALTPQAVKANSQGRAGLQNQPTSVVGTAQGAPMPVSAVTGAFQ